MDSYGKGLMAYYNGQQDAQFTVESDIAETDVWPVSEFFHSWQDMSDIERRALTLCHGRTLDVGAGSGSHTLWLQEHDVLAEALDISPLAVEVMRRRGVQCAHLADFYAFSPDNKYDTLLLLMNGAGVAGTMDNLPLFLRHCAQMLNPGGQIIMDSSDLIYLYANEDGSVDIDLNGAYYGELQYTFGFNGETDQPFKWLFVDPASLTEAAEACGLKCELILEDDHFQYLARLTRSTD